MTYRGSRSGRAFVLPAANAAEVALVRGAVIHPAPTLLAVCAHLTGESAIPRFSGEQVAPAPTSQT